MRLFEFSIIASFCLLASLVLGRFLPNLLQAQLTLFMGREAAAEFIAEHQGSLTISKFTLPILMFCFTVYSATVLLDFSVAASWLWMAGNTIAHGAVAAWNFAAGRHGADRIGGAK